VASYARAVSDAQVGKGDGSLDASDHTDHATLARTLDALRCARVRIGALRVVGDCSDSRPARTDWTRGARSAHIHATQRCRKRGVPDRARVPEPNGHTEASSAAAAPCRVASAKRRQQRARRVAVWFRSADGASGRTARSLPTAAARGSPATSANPLDFRAARVPAAAGRAGPNGRAGASAARHRADAGARAASIRARGQRGPRSAAATLDSEVACMGSVSRRGFNYDHFTTASSTMPVKSRA
jgi:hypothetical protein